MRGLHRLACVAFVAAGAAIHWAAAAPPGGRGGRYLLLHGLLSALALAAFALGRRQQTPAAARRTTRWLLGAGIAVRLLVAGAPSFTTHDVSRYLWDGAVALAGSDPYRLTPQSPELAQLRGRWPVEPEHLPYPTLYPPLALAAFSGCALLGPSLAPVAWRLLTTLASLATLLWVAALLVRHDRASWLAGIALNPLLILEAGLGAHADILAAAALAGALLLLDGRRPTAAGVALAAAVACKLTPVVVLVAWWQRRVALGAALALAALYGAALALGLRPLGSLVTFLSGWRFGAPPFALAEGLLGEHAASLSAAALTLGLATLAALRWRGVAPARGDAPWQAPARWGGRAMLLLVAVSPVLFPWYLTPLAVLVAVAPSWTGYLVMAALPLTYEVIDAFDATGLWQPAAWPLWGIAAAWSLGALLDLLGAPGPFPAGPRDPASSIPGEATAARHGA